MSKPFFMPTEEESEHRADRALREIDRLSEALERSLTEQKRLQLLIRGFGATLREPGEHHFPRLEALPPYGEDELRESEARFRAATEGSLDAFMVLKTIRGDAGNIVDFEIADLNGRAAKLIAKPRENLLQKRISSVLPHSRLSPGVFERYARVAETGMPLEEEFPVDAPGIHARWLRHQVVPISGGVAITARDITRRKRVEIREKTQSAVNCVLAEAQTLEHAIPRLLEVVCENLTWSVGEIWVVEPDGDFLRCAGTYREASVAASDAVGPVRPAFYPRGQGLPGRVWASEQPAWNIDSEEDRTFTRAPVASPGELLGAYAFPILAEGEVVGVMEFFRREAVEPDEHIVGTMGELGLQVGQFLGRKLADKALHESEEKYHTVFEGSPLPIFLYDTSTLRIVDVNGAVLQHYGYTRPEILSMGVDEILSADSIARMSRDPNSPWIWPAGTWTHRKKSGAEMDVAVWPHELRIAGRSLCVLVVSDITEQRRLEGELRQSQKMDAIGRLAGGVAHDFNNLLTAILGYGDLVARSLPEEDKAQGHLREILKAGKRAAGLTQQLLAFSRKQVVMARVLDLNAAVREIEKMLRRIIGEDIELVTRLDAGTGNARSDPGQLEQVILNLAVNARDSMPTGGRLTIETQRVPIDQQIPELPSAGPASYVMLSVTDSGIGMDAETLSHVFEPFFTTKQNGKGTGLGLATVYGIVQQNEGHIFVQSEPGKGTTFRIYLPRVDEDAEVLSIPAVEDDEELRGSETVLLVEDEDAVRRLADETLRGLGYTVLSASGGQEALQIAQRHPDPIDLIVTDVVMPGLNGREVASRVSALRPGILALHMSGYTDSVIAKHGAWEPGTLLQKPFTSSELARRVRAILNDGKPARGSKPPMRRPGSLRTPRSGRRRRPGPVR